MKSAPGPDPLFDADRSRRAIRSFVLREGRLTPGQERALERLWPVHGIPNSRDLIDVNELFEREAPTTLEIGFGAGEALAAMAAAFPERNFIGIEVHRPGVGRLLMRLEEAGLTNVRVLCADAVQALTDRFPDGALAAIHLYFPDPWPKKRHHKRRIVQPPFVDLVYRRLMAGGLFHLATDWAPYAHHMIEAVEAHGGFRNRAGPGQFSPAPDWRPCTRFQRRGERLGHGVWDLLFERTEPAVENPGAA